MWTAEGRRGASKSSSTRIRPSATSTPTRPTAHAGRGACSGSCLSQPSSREATMQRSLRRPARAHAAAAVQAGNTVGVPDPHRDPGPAIAQRHMGRDRFPERRRNGDSLSSQQSRSFQALRGPSLKFVRTHRGSPDRPISRENSIKDQRDRVKTLTGFEVKRSCWDRGNSRLAQNNGACYTTCRLWGQDSESLYWGCENLRAKRGATLMIFSHLSQGVRASSLQKKMMEASIVCSPS